MELFTLLQMHDIFDNYNNYNNFAKQLYFLYRF